MLSRIQLGRIKQDWSHSCSLVRRHKTDKTGSQTNRHTYIHCMAVYTRAEKNNTRNFGLEHNNGIKRKNKSKTRRTIKGTLRKAL